MTLKIFKATFPGLWMGGKVVVLADTPAEAAVFLRDALEDAKQAGLNVEADVAAATWTEAPYERGIVYLDTGNY